MKKNTAKILMLTACIILMLAFVSCYGNNSDDNSTSRDGEDLYFELSLDGESYSVIGIEETYIFPYKKIIIPEEHLGKPVTEIKCLGSRNYLYESYFGEMSFSEYNYDLEYLEIPKSIKGISYGMLDNCSKLKEVRVDKNNPYYKDIDGVLYTKNGSGLICYPEARSNKSYQIPDSVTSIGGSAFSGCSSLASIDIPDGVTSIGDSAFSGCSSLTSINIPNGVTKIGYSAFSGCSSLTSMVIPDSVTSIGDSPFEKCSKLNSISVGKNNGYYKSIDGNLYTIDGKTIIQYAPGKATTKFEIPNSVEKIGRSAFCGSSHLVSVVIPDSVTIIGEHAFSNCSNLISVVIPDSVTWVESYAFTNCVNLTIYCEAESEPHWGYDWDLNYSYTTNTTGAQSHDVYHSVVWDINPNN